jgi:hypothetical protein
LIDFWRRGLAPPPKIIFLLRPVGALEIFTPVLKRTPPKLALDSFAAFLYDLRRLNSSTAN